ncbi:MAG: phosphate propanoyltransferase [Actinobacteria bacterium]|nr:phosphate propanoyltransferase [Actinomycetota bacterium]
MDTEQLIRDVVKNVMEKLERDKQTMGTASSSGSASVPSASGGDLSQLRRTDKKIVCGVSVRHIHLCSEHLDILFGKGYTLNVLRGLYNPGYAAKETLTVVGPKLNAIQNVRILGPLRSKTQVELAKTDCIILGIDAPVRPSGEISGSASAVLRGPKGAVYLNEGVIRANRHMHLSSEDADFFGIKDNQVVDVRVGGPKGLTFNNVQVRVAPDFKTELHVDTDDGNAADVINGTMVEIVDASCVSPISITMADKEHTPPSIPDGSFSGEMTDTNLLSNMCTLSTGQPCRKGQVTGAPASSSAENGACAGSGAGSAQYGQSALTKKTVITMENLDNYIQTGIEVSPNVILSPLARDEAVARGIKITYLT